MEGKPEQRKEFFNKLRTKVIGNLMEDIVRLEASKIVTKTHEVFKFMFKNGGEYDMVVWDTAHMKFDLYEIKHKSTGFDSCLIHMRDDDKLEVMSRKFGELNNRYLLWNGGSSVTPDGIKIQNCSEFLEHLEKIYPHINNEESESKDDDYGPCP